MPQGRDGPSDWTTHVVETDGGDTTHLLDREWLLTAGTGAYAMGTALGVNTRRYHGLLVATTNPPVERVVVLNQMVEELVLEGRFQDAGAAVTRSGQAVTQQVPTAACLFRSLEHGSRDPVYSPHGHHLLRRFTRGVTCGWQYGWGPVTVTRELAIHHRSNGAATIRYTVEGLPASASDTARLKLMPMLTLRDFHHLVWRRDLDSAAMSVDIRDGGQAVTVQRGGLSATVRVAGGAFEHDPCWWYNCFYPVDADRGQGDTEDVFVPGQFMVPLDCGVDINEVVLTVALGTDAVDPEPTPPPRAAALEPIRKTIASALVGIGGELPRPDALAIAADDFVVDRTIAGERLKTVLAGYPWFADWGRDTFIALPGLLLVTGRHDEARAVLRAFADALRDGLIPNRFDDYAGADAHYNTVDASLWYTHAALQYVEASGDDEAWEDWLAEACVRVCDGYIHGTDYDIKMSTDGLIEAGGPDTQLTWMDAAAVNGRGERVVFTPRHGKCVEINALWYNALAGLAETLPDAHNQERKHYEKLCGRIKRAFTKTFWNDEAGCLFDHVIPSGNAEVDDGADRSIRPNQVFATALPRSPLAQTKARDVLKVVKQKLLTPFGLRTLPTDDPHYHGRYAGAQFDRDQAYHQGTVWPWLIGPYAEGVLRAGKFSPEAKAEALGAITPLLRYLRGPGLGQVAEIFEGDPDGGWQSSPWHHPKGCPAQAWSIAELLRVLALIKSAG